MALNQVSINKFADNVCYGLIKGAVASAQTAGVYALTSYCSNVPGGVGAGFYAATKLIDKVSSSFFNYVFIKDKGEANTAVKVLCYVCTKTTDLALGVGVMHLTGHLLAATNNTMGQAASKAILSSVSSFRSLATLAVVGIALPQFMFWSLASFTNKRFLNEITW